MTVKGELRKVVIACGGAPTKNTIPGLRVLSYQEIPDDKQIKIVSVIGNNQNQQNIGIGH